MNSKFTRGFSDKVKSLLGKEVINNLNNVGGGNRLPSSSNPAQDKNVSQRGDSYWFNQNKPTYLQSRKKNSDSWFRLEAFLSTRPPEELQKIDPSYGEPIQ